jgi:hypothetical protein
VHFISIFLSTFTKKVSVQLESEKQIRVQLRPKSRIL